MRRERDPQRARRPARLDRSDLLADPLEQLACWMDDGDPSPMALATLGSDGGPVLRTVPLRGLAPDGLMFHSDLRTAKVEHLRTDARAAALIRWEATLREVRVIGRARRCTAEVSDAAYREVTTATRLRAWTDYPREADHLDRTTLERLRAEATAIDPARRDIRPESWSAFLLEPSVVELWQQSDDGIEDRFAYRRAATGWTLRRLPP